MDSSLVVRVKKVYRQKPLKLRINSGSICKKSTTECLKHQLNTGNVVVFTWPRGTLVSNLLNDVMLEG